MGYAVRCLYYLFLLTLAISQPPDWPEWPDYPDPQNCSAPAVPVALEDESASDLLRMVHVVYSSNSNKKNLGLLLGSMLSLARHLGNPQQCTIHLLVAESDATNLNALADCFRRELAAGSYGVPPNVVLHVMETMQLNISDPRRPDIAQNTYFRYYVHRYLPDAPRAILLDADTIVRTDIAPLYRMRMRHAVAAKRVHWSLQYLRDMFKLGSYIRNPDAPAFNAGVLLYDLAHWRSGEFTLELEAWTPLTSVFLYDQTPLNILFQDNIDVLDWRWNVLHLGWARVARRCFNQARILHWNGPRKALGRLGRYRHLVEPYGPKLQCDVLL